MILNVYNSCLLCPWGFTSGLKNPWKFRDFFYKLGASLPASLAGAFFSWEKPGHFFDYVFNDFFDFLKFHLGLRGASKKIRLKILRRIHIEILPVEAWRSEPWPKAWKMYTKKFRGQNVCFFLQASRSLTACLAGAFFPRKTRSLFLSMKNMEKKALYLL